jgi:hypothetical protein
MGKIVSLIGLKFNRLLVVDKVKALSKASAYWQCLCDCGEITVVAGCKLKTGATKSCGCYRKTVFTNYKHGQANKTKTYKTWKLMRSRCYTKTADNYKWYGGEGITVCERWSDYTNFLNDMGERPIGKTIDRIDTKQGYFKENCRWATPKEQAENNSGCFKKHSALGHK